MIRLLILGIALGSLVACGGGSGDSSAGGGDTLPPGGYLISSLTDPIDIASQSIVSFNLANAETDTTYRYTFTDEQNAQVTGTGAVTLSSQTITGIDLSGLANGNIQLQLTLTDSSNNIGDVVEAAATKQVLPQSQTVSISGQITFDRVPYNIDGIGLDYDAIRVVPIKEATLRIVDIDSTVVASSKTDSTGTYQVEVPLNTEVRVEVLAELFEANPSLNWLTRVVNDSSGNSLYVLRGSLVDSGELDQTRNLHASSGWDGVAYSAERSAAPFAILDSIYQIYDQIRSEGVSLSMPELEIRWSGNNADGSFYRSGGNSYIEVGGAADLDTDEYDQHVIIHEWLHYYEDKISRGDTIGGSHSLNSLLEPRTSYSEGRGNAWSGIVLADPIYKDALGADQQNGFDLDLEGETAISSGWYSERSVQEIIYDLVDTNNEGVDTLSMSISDLLGAWQSFDYINQSSLTTIYSLGEILSQMQPASETAIASLMQNEDIMGAGKYGAGETNDGGKTYALPVYHELLVGAVPIEVCSNNAADGEYNRLENRQLIRFSINTEGAYKVEMSRDAGNTNFDGSVETDPDFVVYLKGVAVTDYDAGEGSSPDVDVEVFVRSFVQGDYVLEAFDWFNADEDGATGGLSCFDISVVPD